MTMHQAQTAADEGHTPTPWRVSNAKPTKTRGIDILGGHALCIAHVPVSPEYYTNRPHEPNAEYIVRACNSHDELVGVLRTVCAILDDYRAPGDELPAFEDPSELVNELEKRGVHEAITAAIASATGAA